MKNQTQNNQTQTKAVDRPKRRGRRWLRWLGGVVVLLVGLILAGTLYEPVAEAADIRAYPYSGSSLN